MLCLSILYKIHSVIAAGSVSSKILQMFVVKEEVILRVNQLTSFLVISCLLSSLILSQTWLTIL